SLIFIATKRAIPRILVPAMHPLEDMIIKLGISPPLVYRMMGTLGILFVWFVLQRVIRRIVARTVDEPSARFEVTRLSGYFVAIVALIALVWIWFQGITGLATYLGLLSAGLAIALQDPLANLAGWLYIIFRRPFRIGDRIEVGSYAGDVVDIRP